MKSLTLVFVFLAATPAPAFQGLPDGRYESPCMPTAVGSMQEAWVFSDSTRRFFQAVTTFHDSTCRQVDATESWAGNYVIGEELPDPEGSWQLDLEFVRPDDRDPLFTLVRINGDELTFGEISQDYPGNSADKRPITIEEDEVFLFDSENK